MRILLFSLSVLLASTTSFAMGTQLAPPASQAVPQTMSSTQLADAKCIIGLEKFIPGDYFYCLGAQTYGTQHYQDSLKFFQEAASWASKPAEYVLGVMAMNGDHQPVNRPLGLAWLTLAAERGTPRFAQALATYSQHATPPEWQQSRKILARLRATYADQVAAARAEERYRLGMKTIRSQAAATSYCLAGQADFRDLAGGGMGGGGAHCSPVEQVMAYIDDQANNVFEDWHGHATIGPLQVVRAPNK